MGAVVVTEDRSPTEPDGWEAGYDQEDHTGCPYCASEVPYCACYVREESDGSLV